MQLRRGQRVRIKLRDFVGILHNRKFDRFNGQSGVVECDNWVEVVLKGQTNPDKDSFADIIVYQVALDSGSTIVDVPLDALELIHG